MPNSANYQQIRIMARSGDGRGPFLAYNNRQQMVSPAHVDKKKKKTAQNTTQPSSEKRRAYGRLPPRAVNAKISYKD